MTSVTVTVHACTRCRKRLGVPRRAVGKMIELAWTRGVPERCGVVKLIPNQVVKIYGGGRFFFEADSLGVRCLTVLGKHRDEKRLSVTGEGEHWQRIDRRVRRRKISRVACRAEIVL